MHFAQIRDTQKAHAVTKERVAAAPLTITSYVESVTSGFPLGDDADADDDDDFIT